MQAQGLAISEEVEVFAAAVERPVEVAGITGVGIKDTCVDMQHRFELLQREWVGSAEAGVALVDCDGIHFGDHGVQQIRINGRERAAGVDPGIRFVDLLGIAISCTVIDMDEGLIVAAGDRDGDVLIALVDLVTAVGGAEA